MSRSADTRELDLSDYSLVESKKDFDNLNRWLSKTVQTFDPDENLRQAVDKLHRIGGDQRGLEKSILIMKHLAELNDCDDRALQSLRLVVATTGAVGGVIRRLDVVMRHFAQMAAAKCESYLDLKMANQSKSVKVNLEGLEPSVGRVENLPLTLAKHDGPFNPNGADLAALITFLARGDERNTYQSQKRQGVVYHFSNLEYTYERYLAQPCREYIRQSKETVELVQPVRMFRSADRTGEDFFSRRSQGFQLALFRYQVCEDIIREAISLGDIFDALTI